MFVFSSCRFLSIRLCKSIMAYGGIVMNKKYIVRLTDDERQQLVHLTKIGEPAAYKIKHAHILLQVDADGPNWSDEHVAKVFRCHGNTVRNVRQRFVEQGLEAALARQK